MARGLPRAMSNGQGSCSFGGASAAESSRAMPAPYGRNYTFADSCAFTHARRLGMGRGSVLARRVPQMRGHGARRIRLAQSTHMSSRHVGSADAPPHGAGLAPRDEQWPAQLFIRRRKRRRIVAGDGRALRRKLHFRRLLRLHTCATASNGAWVGLGAASSADARPWRAHNPADAQLLLQVDL